MRTARSWGQAVRLLHPHDVTFYADRWDASPEDRRWLGCQYGGNKHRCGARPTHESSYLYVTGRQGRVTDRRTRLCEEHARAYAERFGLPWPAAVAEERPGDVAMRSMRSFIAPAPPGAARPPAGDER